MSITDELREWAKDNTLQDMVLTTYPPQHAVYGVLETILRIADRIDAEHESACAEAYGNGVMSVPIALDESAWVKLPKDADGVPIHAGDKLTDGEYTFTVCELAVFGDGSWSIRNEDGNAWAACDVTHHHAPTVEDVLREFAERYLDYEGVPSAGRRGIGEALMDEYAKRLTLAEGEDA